METPELIDQVERFLAETGMTPTKFGWKALKDPVFVRDLRAGREPRRRTRERVTKFIVGFKSKAA